MVHGSPTTASSNEGNVGAMQLRKVHFFPRILVSTYNDAWPIAVDEQERLVSWLFLEQPAMEFSSDWVSTERWGHMYQSSKVRLK